MPLPKELDARVRKRFAELVNEGESLVERFGEGVDNWYVVDHFRFTMSVKNLVRVICKGSGSIENLEYIKSLENTDNKTTAGTILLGVLRSLKDDYESGMLDDSSWSIETNVTYDFMEQVNRLLGGERNDYDHVPAAVLAGAVLEDALRRLCQRQTPPIETESNGKPKTLDLLISDLQKSNVFNKPKAAQLRSWASIRNSAAHGKFKEFDRAQVEQMIPGIETFLADYLK